MLPMKKKFNPAASFHMKFVAKSILFSQVPALKHSPKFQGKSTTNQNLTIVVQPIVLLHIGFKS